MAYKPTDGMKEEARKGLEWRREFGRGGTAVGVARARDIVNGKELSESTVKRMHSFFSRHEVDKKAEGFRPGEDGYPSAGRIAWALWSGDLGQAWAAKIVRQLNSDDERSSFSSFLSHLSALLASPSDSAIRSFFRDYVVAFNLMASRANPQLLGDKVFISATIDVLAGGDWFEMRGIDARSVAAEVVNVMSNWDWADNQLVTEAMGWREDFSASFATDDEVAITATGLRAGPIPATIIASTLVNLHPEAFNNSHVRHSVSSIINLPIHTASVGKRKAPLLYEERPYPNEHAARIRDPEKYDDFRRMNDEGGAGIDFIIGLWDGQSEIQSIRFDADEYSVSEAKDWLDRNNFTAQKFEPAIGSEERAVQTDEKDDMIPEATEGAEMSEKRAEPDELSVGDYVEWDSSGGEAYGRVERIERDGQIDVPDADVTINGDAEDPAALIEVYREGEDGWAASGVMVGHRFSELRKVAARGYKEKDRFSRDDMKTRSMDGSADIIDMDKRTVRIAVSSEEPVERSFGAEILDHSEASIDLEFARSGRMPLLLDHDPRQQIGVVESVDLDGSTRRLRATVRFGRNGLAKEVFEDVADGIRSNISVGYAVNKMDREGSDRYRVSSWSPMEVSVVSIPADRTVGVGRAAETSPAKPIPATPRMETTMTDEVKIDVEAVKAEAARAAAKETGEIYRLAAKHNKREMADEAVKNGTSLAEFRGQLLDVIGSKPLDDSAIGLSKKEVRNFSLMRAIRAMANPSDRGARAAAEFEFEAAAEAAKRDGIDPQGLYIPADVRRSWAKRDLNTSDDSAMVAEDYRGGDFIDVLRNASSVMQAGATMLTGLVGDVKIPKKTAASTAGWISTEGGVSSESEPTFGQVTMSPKTLGAFTDITRLMMMQSSLDIEALVRNDLSTGLALAIDNGALQGSGSSGQPTGIKNTSGINAPTAFAAANPTFAEVVAMETAVAEDNALMGNLAYILPASMYGALKTTVKDSGSGQFVVAPDGSMNGYRAIVSNQVTAGDLYFGNFSDLLIGMYGGLDITVDPYTASTSGTVRIVALQTVDVAVRHAVSFAFNNDGV